MIEPLRTMSPQAVSDAVAMFSRRYHCDWQRWMATPHSGRTEALAQLLRRWQATRPHACRRPGCEAKHGQPFLDDLLRSAQEPLDALVEVDMRSLYQATFAQRQAMSELWGIFRQLAVEGYASCVGISKAVLLLTDGRIGPAFDSSVRQQLHISAPRTAGAWIGLLDAVGADIRDFESRSGTTLNGIVPEPFRGLGVGRLYDMVLGPRNKSA